MERKFVDSYVTSDRDGDRRKEEGEVFTTLIVIGRRREKRGGSPDKCLEMPVRWHFDHRGL